jgi:NitT/TauT family transport system substrate-binding protein
MRIAALFLVTTTILIANAPARAEKLTVSQYGRITATLPWAVALKKGYLQENGLNIDGVISGAGGGTSLRNMLAGDLPFADISITAVIPAAKQGLRLKIVMGSSNHVGELAWAVKPESSYRALKDLVGQKIAFTGPRSTTEMIVRAALKREGLVGKVEPIAMGGLGPALTALAQDAVAAAPWNDPSITREPDKYRMLFQAQDVFPKFTWSVGVVTEAFLKEHPDKIRALIQAHRRAVEFMYANRDETAKIYSEIFSIDQGLAAKLLPKYYDWNHWSKGDLSKEGLQAIESGMNETGELQGKVDWSSLIDQSLLDEDLRRPL